MRRILLIILSTLLILAGLNFVLTKKISNWFLSAKSESSHFVIISRPSDSNLAQRLQSIFEKDYLRLQKYFAIDPKNKITVHLFSNNQLYNMAFGNPFPLPRKIDNYAGQHIKNETFLLIPKVWEPLPDTVFPPERTRTTAAHEMTHVFAYALNNNVRDWVTEGMAKYEENACFNNQIRKIGYSSWIGQNIKDGKIPKFDEMFSGKKITSPQSAFDYLFAATFFDYATSNYQNGNIVEFIKTYDFNSSFGKPENEIWSDWVKYLNENYID